MNNNPSDSEPSLRQKYENGANDSHLILSETLGQIVQVEWLDLTMWRNEEISLRMDETI